jgi:hypothetical protein
MYLSESCVDVSGYLACTVGAELAQDPLLVYAPRCGTAVRRRSQSDVYLFGSKLFRREGQVAACQKINLTAKPVSAVPPGNLIKADMSLTHTIRHVMSGDATYEQKDDEVLDRTAGPVTKTVTLVSALERLHRASGYSRCLDRTETFAVNAARPSRAPVGLCFDGYSEASDFLTLSLFKT